MPVGFFLLIRGLRLKNTLNIALNMLSTRGAKTLNYFPTFPFIQLGKLAEMNERLKSKLGRNLCLSERYDLIF